MWFFAIGLQPEIGELFGNKCKTRSFKANYYYVVELLAISCNIISDIVDQQSHLYTHRYTLFFLVIAYTSE